MKPMFVLFITALLLTGCVRMQDGTNLSSLSNSGSSRPLLSTHTGTVSTAPSKPTMLPVAPTTMSVDPTVPTQPFYATVTYIPVTENNGVTYTGLPALPILEYQIIDPENKRQLAEKRLDYFFGVASDGKPHSYSVNHQKQFDQWGTGALAWDNISEDKVLYLTFDCGYAYKNRTSVILDVLKEKKVPATFFVTMSFLESSPNVVARMIGEGHHVGNHSLRHPDNCASLSREEMALEALAVENHLRHNFGYTAKYFRFPAGVYSENAVELLASVGYRSVFWSLAHTDWDPEKQIGKEPVLKILTDRLHPGAVILLHSTSADNFNVLADFIDNAISQGYRFADLDDYPGWQ